MVNDTIAFVKDIITTELNSATDNPVSFERSTRLQLSVAGCVRVCVELVCLQVDIPGAEYLVASSRSESVSGRNRHANVGFECSF